MKDIHIHISDYLDSERKDYLTEDFGYSSYTAPNTMYQVSNDLDEILLKLPYSALKVWHRTMTLLKRNHDPVIACSVLMKYDYYSDLISKPTYHRSVKILVDADLLITTSKSTIKIVNVKYANKLFKPKFELP